MNKYLKRFLALGIVGASVLTFSACAMGNDEGKGDDPGGPVYVDPTPDNPKPDDPTPVDPTPDDPVVNPDKEFNEFLANLNAEGSYTYTLSEDDFYLVEGTSVKACLDGNRDGDFYVYEDGVPYAYRFESSKGLWHKEDFEEYNVNSLVLDELNSAIVTDYDEKTETYSIEMGGKVYTATLDDEGLTMALENGEEFSISEIGSTEVNLPRAMFIVDDTEKDPENPPITDPEDPVVDEDKVYTLDEQGNRVYDSKVLAEVFLTALNSTKEGETETIYQDLTFGASKSVNEVKFVSTADNSLKFGALTESKSGNINFGVFELNISSIDSLSANKSDWINVLMDKNVYELPDSSRVQYTTDDAQYGEIVETAFENVANKLAENGVQKDSINTLGTPITKLKNSDVIWAYSIENDRTGAGYDMGNTARCGLAGVILNAEGKYEYFETAIVTRWLTTETPLETVAKDGVFLVSYLENNIEANSDFYKTEITSAKSIDLYNEKEGKELEM